jgi:hypothetical protein
MAERGARRSATRSSRRSRRQGLSALRPAARPGRRRTSGPGTAACPTTAAGTRPPRRPGRSAGGCPERSSQPSLRSLGTAGQAAQQPGQDTVPGAARQRADHAILRAPNGPDRTGLFQCIRRISRISGTLTVRRVTDCCGTPLRTAPRLGLGGCARPFGPSASKPVRLVLVMRRSVSSLGGPGCRTTSVRPGHTIKEILYRRDHLAENRSGGR